MAIDPNRKDPATRPTTRSRYDPRDGGAARWGAIIIGAVLVALVLLWFGGMFDDTTDTATTPATTRGDAAAPAAPAPLAPALPQ